MTPSADTATPHAGWWVPNALTISRILIIPILIAGIIAFANSSASPFANGYLLFFLIFYAMASDFLDGFLARRWKLVSGFGRMIDPIALCRRLNSPNGRQALNLSQLLCCSFG